MTRDREQIEKSLHTLLEDIEKYPTLAMGTLEWIILELLDRVEELEKRTAVLPKPKCNCGDMYCGECTGEDA